VNGLFRHGFLIAPVVLEQTLAVIANRINNTAVALPYTDLLPIVFDSNYTCNINQPSRNLPESSYEHSY
ncbi:MAG: glycine oxidase, partial [Colwellia sp.]